MKAKPTHPEREIPEGNSTSRAYPEYLYQRLEEGRSLIQGNLVSPKMSGTDQTVFRHRNKKDGTELSQALVQSYVCLFLSFLKKIIFKKYFN